jgi:hypothetical protein
MFRRSIVSIIKRFSEIYLVGALLKVLTPHLFQDVQYVQHEVEQAAKRNYRIFTGLGCAGFAHHIYTTVKRPHDSQKIA